jgi:aldehyde:ferredoxin oxidoreductase
MQDLIQAVKQHADSTFSNGWDYIAECWSDEEIAAEIKGCRTVSGAIRKMKKIADDYAEMQSNARW